MLLLLFLQNTKIKSFRRSLCWGPVSASICPTNPKHVYVTRSISVATGSTYRKGFYLISGNRSKGSAPKQKKRSCTEYGRSARTSLNEPVSRTPGMSRTTTRAPFRIFSFGSCSRPVLPSAPSRWCGYIHPSLHSLIQCFSLSLFPPLYSFPPFPSL